MSLHVMLGRLDSFALLPATSNHVVNAASTNLQLTSYVIRIYRCMCLRVCGNFAMIDNVKA